MEGGQARSPLRILAHVHGYPPGQNAGAEQMLHVILRRMVSRGHQARVMLAPGQVGYSLQGVDVLDLPTFTEHTGFFRWAEHHAAWANVIVTHLDFTQNAVGIARVNARPLVHLVHNEFQLTFHQVRAADLVVFNSDWVAAAADWPGRRMIVHPPVFAADYRTQGNGRRSITLIATIKLKGVETFYEVARRMSAHHFIGVRGAYSLNVDPPPDLPNVEIVPNGPGIQQVYARTRLLLVPSFYESYSRSAIEAASSGIPVIAAPTPGLRESLGEAGIFCKPDDVGAWCRAIAELDDDETYERASQAVTARAAELEARSETELDDLEQALMSVAR